MINLNIYVAGIGIKTSWKINSINKQAPAIDAEVPWMMKLSKIVVIAGSEGQFCYKNPNNFSLTTRGPITTFHLWWSTTDRGTEFHLIYHMHCSSGHVHGCLQRQ